MSFELPAGWDDETIVILQAPAKVSALPMRPNPGSNPRASLVIKRTPLSSSLPSLEVLARAEIEMLRNMIADVEITEQPAIEIDGQRALVRELRFSGPEGYMRQLQVSVVAAGSFFSCVGTAVDDVDFVAARAQFLAVLSSVRFQLAASPTTSA